MPVQRQLRPLKQCPFCAEPVRAEAIKCRHCGEFLDGRPRADDRPVQQMIVIDKEALQAMNDLRLYPGLPVPNAARRVLDAKTVRAIENNKPDQIDHPSVRLLPSPDGTPSEEGKSLPAVRSADPENVAEGHALAVRPAGTEGEGKQLPAKAQFAPLARAKKELPARRTPDAAAGAAKKGAAADGAIDAEVDATFRVCHKCQTEILAIDSFCYYCGTQYHRTQRDQLRDRASRRKSRHRIAKMVVLFAILGVIAAGAYLLWVAGYFSDEQKLGELKDTIGAGVGELKTVDPRALSAAKTCRANLQTVEAAKGAVAARERLTTGPIALEALLAQLQLPALPVCPAGGTYSLNPVNRPTTCSIGNNGTAATWDDHIIP